ncbi:MAG: cofactor-independent phosphoglycerate mutase [Deltaproteobacteria bacterium]|nr:cofactor-independent phosphoglycerate mutase [Deltaproteobacteria bacterium]
MKYFILLCDGAADEPLKELGGKTPLEYAHTENMDRIAGGFTGMVRNVPEGMEPASDIANMSILGYDPKKYYTGRAPLELAARNIPLKENDVAYRCNFVTIENEVMKDYSAGHLSTGESEKLIAVLNNSTDPGWQFFSGVGYRNLLVWENGEVIPTTPPHNISGKHILPFLPKGKLLMVMKKMHPILENHPVNLRRREKGLNEANYIWLWGGGKKPSIPSFREKFKKTGAMISAVDLMKGIARLIGFKVIDVKGATAFIDTNYKGKVEAAFKALEEVDLSFIHVEAPDEAGHLGDVELKIRAIELFDKEVVKRVLDFSQDREVKILLLPDHPTPITLRTHTADPVPFAIWDSRKDKNKKGLFNEKSGKRAVEGCRLLPDFLFKEG